MALWYHRTDSYRWINGSIRQDLTSEERGVWADFMALAALTRETRRGHIERSQGIPYPKTVLVTMLNISEELFDRTVRKCCNEGRLQLLPDGTMFLVNWNKYNNVEEYETKKRLKNTSKKKVRENQGLLTACVDSLKERVNTLNLRLHNMRYQITSEGKVLDTQTGEICDDAPELPNEGEADGRITISPK